MSKIFPNEAFGYWKLTVERPLRLEIGLSAKRRDQFRASCKEAKELPMAGLVDRLAAKLGPGPHRDLNVIMDMLTQDARQLGVKLTAKRQKLLRDSLAERSEEAEPVVAKKHKLGKVELDPLRGLCEVTLGGKRWVVEYEPDPKLRDTEQVPLLEEGGVEAFLKREVLPYAEDAWYVPASMKIGYEISFTRYFYKPKPLRTLAEIRSEIVAVEREAEGLLGGFLGGEPLAGERKLRVYADTSVIGGCEDVEFREPSRRLIERCARGEVTLVVSAITIQELEDAPQAVRAVLRVIDTEDLEVIAITEEVRELADRYIESGALSAAMRADAQHIAAATLADVDVLASWNFRHMVNLTRIRQYNEVNRRVGYPEVDIRSPMELENAE